MIWKAVLVVLLSTVVMVVTYYIAYASIFLYIYLCETRKPGSGNRLVRKIFSPIACHVVEARQEFDVEALKRVDPKMVKRPPLMIFLIFAVLAFLGFLTVVAFRHLIGA